MRKNYVENGREWQIYSEIVWIRREKIKEDERKNEEWY